MKAQPELAHQTQPWLAFSPITVANVRVFALVCAFTLTVITGCAKSANVDANPAVPDQFPWMASTQLAAVGANRATCGGSLVAPDWVLTGKHCHGDGPGADPGSWQVRVDSIDRTAGGELLPVSRFVDYPDDAVDLSLIQLARPSTVKPLALIPINETAPYEIGASAITLGWGTNGEEATPETYLDWSLQETATNDSCGGGSDGVFCGGRPNNQGSGTCAFDSGGPYVWAEDGFDSDGTPRSEPYVAGTLRGLFNETCGQPGKNDDWQSTSGAYGQWIRQQIR